MRGRVQFKNPGERAAKATLAAEPGPSSPPPVLTGEGSGPEVPKSGDDGASTTKVTYKIEVKRTLYDSGKVLRHFLVSENGRFAVVLSRQYQVIEYLAAHDVPDRVSKAMIAEALASETNQGVNNP